MKSVALVVCLFFCLQALSSEAGTVIMVDTTLDTTQTDGRCSLREAIENAEDNTQLWPDCAAGSEPSPDVIQFDNTLLNETIELQSALPTIEESLRIIGLEDNGPAITLDGMDAFSLIRIGDASTVDLQNLVLTRGRSSASDGGAAIDAPNALTLSIQRTRIVNNLSINGPVVSFNRNGTGSGDFTMVDSVLQGNRSEWLGTGKVLLFVNSTVRIERSEISDNIGSASSGGGIVRLDESSTLNMLNSTISGNRLENSAAGSAFTIINSDAELKHVTIVDNRSNGLQRPIFVFASNESANLSLINSVVIGESDSEPVCVFSGSGTTTLSEIGTFSNDPDCLESSSTVAIDSLALSALGTNGGLSRTHALELESIAIDAAGDCTALDPAVTLDQRSEVRPGANSAACDAGAYEAQIPVDAIFEDVFEHVSVGSR